MPLRHWFERDGPLGYLMVSPAFLFLLFLLAYPVVIAIILSLSEKRLGAPATFVGVENFAKLLTTARFWTAVQNSLVYTAGALALKFAGGLALAQLLNRPFIGRRIVTALILLPWIIPTVFSTLTWWWMLDPANSIINIMLKRWGIITNNLPFLVDETWAMTSLILLNTWRGVPFFAITFLAAIQTVPEELIEAAKMDGASAWQRFWRVTFPLIIPVVVIVVLISTISTLADFELPYLLTRGGPRDATMVFGLLSYEYALGLGQLGLGAAVSLTMLPVLALLVVLSLIEIRQAD
ncbi:MAG TPA: sugar ABC transporter permease [Caldilineaceae bacterium]|nr:sugar ABC transporter permease [Caldilineaceae bacterium]